jgi:hypothetical protein
MRDVIFPAAGSQHMINASAIQAIHFLTNIQREVEQ